MKVTVTDLSQVRKKLEIEVEKEVIQTEIAQSLQQYRKKAKLKGFRPGKAPLSMIKSLYYEQARQEVMEKLVQRSYVEALTEKSLVPLGMPEIENLSFGEDDDYLNYEAIIEIRPDFEVDDYLDLGVKLEAVEVTEEDIKENLENLRQAYAQFVSVENRPSRDGDTLVIDFVGKIDGEEFPGGSANGYTVEIGAGTFIADLEKQLIGLQIDETRDLNVTFPPDYHKEELAGKPAVFQVTVNEIKEKKLPEINDDFAAEVSGGGIASVEELKKRLAESIESRKKDLARQKAVNELLAKLREMVEFEIPDSLIENEKNAVVSNLRSRYLAQGLEEEMVEKMVASSQERIAQEAADTVRNSLILEKIAAKEGIVCTEGDLGKQLQQLIATSGQSPQTLRERFAGREGELEAMLRSQVIYDKTISMLLGEESAKKDDSTAETVATDG